MSLTRFNLTHFPSRAAILTWLTKGPNLVPGIVVAAGDLCWTYTGSGTAISDMPGWVPAGQVYVGHFGAVGVAAPPANENSFATITPTVNEAVVLQAAMDYCVSNGFDLRGDTSQVYGVSSGLVWGARAASGVGSVVIGFPVLRDLNLKVIGGTWTSGTRPDLDDITTWNWGPAVLTIGKSGAADSLGKFRVSAENVVVDGNRLATGGIWFRAAALSTFISCRAIRCIDYQERIGSNNADGQNCTDSSFYGCAGYEWPYVASGTGFNDLSLRTAVGLLSEGSDVEIIGSTFFGSLYNLVYDGGYNNRFTACKFWAGPVRTDAASRTVWISAAIGGVFNFNGCRFDDGAVLLEAFSGRFVNCRFMQSGVPGNLQLRATAAGETAKGLLITGNTFADEAVATLLTKGVGTWGKLVAVISANVGGTTTPVEYSLDGIPGPVITAYSDAGSSYRTASSLNIDANWQGGGADIRREVRIGNRGVFPTVFTAEGYRKFGAGKGTGGGNILLEAYGAANQYFLEPLQSDGLTLDFARRLEYDPAKSAWGIYGHLVAAADFVQRLTAPATYAAGATLTAANMQTAAITYTGAGANNLQLPLASAMDTAFPSVAADQGIEFTVIATSTGAATLTTNTGWTLVGSMVVAAGASATFRARKTGAAAWTIYRK
jgi:hypothetical protein